jgi:hypothetical protein
LLSQPLKPIRLLLELPLLLLRLFNPPPRLLTLV